MPPAWTRLRHAYGPATEVPAWIAALAGAPDDVVRAAASLEGALAHQGTLYPASAPAVPGILAALPTSAPARVLALLAALAAGDDDAWIAAGAAGPRPYPAHQKARAAVADGAPAHVAPLVDHADPAVRRQAARVLGLAGVGAPALAARLAIEADASVRATLRLAIGLAGAPAPAPPSDDPLDRAAAALAAAYAGPVDDAVEAALRAAAREAPAASDVPWNGGDLAGAARRALDRHLAARPEAAVDLLLEELARTGDLRALEARLRAALPAEPPALAEDASPLARRVYDAVLAAGAPTSAPWAPFRTDFDSDTARDLAIWIGRDESAPYAHRVTVDGRRWPLHRWLAAFAPGSDDLARALAAAPPEVAVRAAVAAARYPHGVGHARATALVEALRDALAAVGEAARPALEAEADRVLRDGARHHDDALLAAALARLAVARGEAPDPRVDALLARPMAQGVGTPTDLLRVALAALPEPRREARVLACRPWEGTELCGAWRFYDLCPTRAVLASLVAHVATFPRGKSPARDDRALALLGAHRAAIEDLLREGAAGKAPRRDLYAAALGDAAPAPAKKKPARRA